MNCPKSGLLWNPLKVEIQQFIAASAHLQLLAMVCARSICIRRIVRSCLRPLIQNARVDYDALESEGLPYDELLRGLRKLSYPSPEGTRIATLEETGTSAPFRCIALKRLIPP